MMTVGVGKKGGETLKLEQKQQGGKINKNDKYGRNLRGNARASDRRAPLAFVEGWYQKQAEKSPETLEIGKK